jgi:hypothetical protein
MNQPKYTQDQKRRAVQEIVRRLNEFDSALKLIRQFDITEHDVMEYLNPRETQHRDPAMYTSLAYDPYTGQPISGWTMHRPKSNTTFDQAVEEADELRTRAIEVAREREEMMKEAHTASVARYMKQAGMVPHPSLKSYMDWS